MPDAGRYAGTKDATETETETETDEVQQKAIEATALGCLGETADVVNVADVADVAAPLLSDDAHWQASPPSQPQPLRSSPHRRPAPAGDQAGQPRATQYPTPRP